MLSYLAAMLLLTFTAVGWVLTVLGMPGNWLMVLAAGLYAWWGPHEGVLQIGWPAVVGLAVLATLGELLELVASVWGARRAGGSRRAAVFALLGSLAGALLGALVGVPIPLVGSMIAALLGAALGALTGAALAEFSLGEKTAQSWRVGRAAFWGRLWGTGAKTVVATIIVAAVFVAVVI